VSNWEFAADAAAVNDAPLRCDQRRVDQLGAGLGFIHSAASLTMLADMEVSSPENMQSGYIPDNSYVAVFQSGWREGNYVGGFLNSLKPAKKPLPIVTYRCMACGFLESYADA